MDKIFVTIGGLLISFWVIWYFLLPRKKKS